MNLRCDCISCKYEKQKSTEDPCYRCCNDSEYVYDGKEYNNLILSEEKDGGVTMGYDSNDFDDGTFKPCPFCGGDASLKLYEPPFTKSRYFYVQCDNCEAMTNPVQIEDHRQVCEAIAKWNRRV